MSSPAVPEGGKTPWGETYDELAEAIAADRSAPPVLALAAFLYRHGETATLQGLVADAVALNESSASPAVPEGGKT